MLSWPFGRKFSYIQIWKVAEKLHSNYTFYFLPSVVLVHFMNSFIIRSLKISFSINLFTEQEINLMTSGHWAFKFTCQAVRPVYLRMGVIGSLVYACDYRDYGVDNRHQLRKRCWDWEGVWLSPNRPVSTNS